MTTALTRRAVFARFRGGPPQLRPPWSRGEGTFTDLCNQCDACIKACPSGIVTRGHAGYPIVQFGTSECTFCGACADACKSGCFDREAAQPWALKATISTACVEPKGVACRMCADACAPRAIKFRPKVGGGAEATIVQSDCTGCGACVAPCPVQAISITQTETMEATA